MPGRGGALSWVPWRQAWHDALYGPTGFYRSAGGPAGSFATSAQGIPGGGEVLARAVVELARREGLSTLVDVGCGRGELLVQVHALAPDLACVGVDVVPRPAGLPADARWVRSPGGADLPPDLGQHVDGAVLVLAGEWLDVVPCTVAELDGAGMLREVLVRPETGEEELGDPLAGADLAWCERWWPLDALSPGDRVEVGLTRDTAWRALVSQVRAAPGATRALVVAVDYGHVAATRPPSGTLTGYRGGRQLPPVPDGSMDVTAHVAVDSLGADELTDQRTFLRELGIRGATPDHARSRTDPAAYLGALARSSAQAALTAPGGLGDFWWAVTRLPQVPAGRLPP